MYGLQYEEMYQRGFRDGFIQGRAENLEIIRELSALTPRPMIIHCENEEMAKNIMKSFREVKE